MNRISLLLSLLLLLFQLGCVTGPKFTSPKQSRGDTALLYVFRPKSTPYAVKPTILVNGIKAAELSSKGYFDLELKPGFYTVRADWSRASGVPDRELTIQAEAGKTYYILVESDSSVYHSGYVGIIPKPTFDVDFRSSMTLVDGDTAMTRIAGCGLVETHAGRDSIPSK